MDQNDQDFKFVHHQDLNKKNISFGWGWGAPIVSTLISSMMQLNFHQIEMISGIN